MAKSMPDFLTDLDIINAKSSREYIGTRLANPAMEMEEIVPTWIRTSSLEDIKLSFDIFQQKVCMDGFPARFSPQFWMANTALQSIYKVLSAFIQANASLEEVQEANQLLFGLWVDLMACGPGSSHLEMIDIFLKHETDPLWRHMTTLTGDDLKLVLACLKTDFVYEEEISCVHYATLMETHVDKVFKRILTAKQYDEAHMEMLDLYGYYLTRMNHVPPHIGPRLSHLCFLISKSYQLENPYLGLEDWVLIRHHLRIIKEVITDKTFTSASEAQYRAPITLEKIFQAAIADGMLETVFKDFLSLLSVLCNYGNCRNCGRLFTVYRTSLFDRLELDKAKSPPPIWMFHQCMATMTTVASNNAITTHMEDLLITAQELCLLKFTQLTLKEVLMWRKLVVNYVVSGRNVLVKQATQLIQWPCLVENKVFAWKSDLSEAKTLIDIVSDLPRSFIQDNENSTAEETVKSYTQFLKELIEQLSEQELLGSVRDNLHRCVLKCVEKDPPIKAVIAQYMLGLDFLDWQNKNFVREVLWTTEKVLRDPEFTWIDDVLAEVIVSLLTAYVDTFQKNGDIPSEFSPMLSTLTLTCLERDAYAFYQGLPPQTPQIYWTLYNNVILPFIRFYQKELSLQHLQPVVEGTLQLLRESLEQGSSAPMCIELLHWLGTSCPELLTNHIEDILYLYLDLECFDEIFKLQVKVYPLDQQPVISRLHDLFTKLYHINRRGRQSILAFLEVVAEHQSQVFGNDHITQLLELYPTETEVAQRSILHILSVVSLEFPDRVLKHYTTLTNDTKFSPTTLTHRAGLLAKLSEQNEDHSKSTIDYMMKHVVSKDPTVSLAAMETLGPLLKSRPQTLSKVKVKLKAVAKSSANVEFRVICQELIPEIVVNFKGSKASVKDVKITSADVKVQPPVPVSKTTANVVVKPVQSQNSVRSKSRSDSDAAVRQQGTSKSVTNTLKEKTKSPSVAKDKTLHQKESKRVTPAEPKVTSAQFTNGTKVKSETLTHSDDGKDKMTLDKYVVNSQGNRDKENLHKSSNLGLIQTHLQGTQKRGDSETDKATEMAMVLPPVTSIDTKSVGDNGGERKRCLPTKTTTPTVEVKNKQPRWMKCFNDMLNTKVDNDWKKLSSFLGYSDDVIQKWTNQIDLSQSLLKTLYATYSSKEASLKLLNALQKIDRPEITLMVENTLKSKNCLELDTDFEYDTPPPVFLSYHWRDQKEALLLWQHLRLAGYQCWLDEGEMGSGDDLLTKIEEGVRGCRVMVSLVSQGYVQSPNCIREVKLAATQNISIIPLMLQQTNWPPQDQLEVIFKDTLYIRFFQRQHEKTRGNICYWPTHKFQELLVQLNYLKISPIQSLISSEYANWWVQLSKDTEEEETENNVEPTLSVDAFPSIFISYQWSRQPYVKALYKQLMLQGFSCWMDIYRHTSSESLYNSIAQGVQACRVVLACVTHKYTLESRCQQELRQASSLNRPIIPILLEKMAWPSKGPLEPILSKTTCLQESHELSPSKLDWSSDTFDRLVQQLQSLVPMKSMELPSKTIEKVFDQDKENTSKPPPTATTVTSKPPPPPTTVTSKPTTTTVTSKPVKSGNRVPAQPVEHTVRSVSHEEISTSRTSEAAGSSRSIHRSDTAPAGEWTENGYDTHRPRSKSCILL